MTSRTLILLFLLILRLVSSSFPICPFICLYRSLTFCTQIMSDMSIFVCLSAYDEIYHTIFAFFFYIL